MNAARKLTPFGKLVVKALADQDMTNAMLANQIGATPQYLSRILRGDRSGEKYIPAIVATLGLDPRRVEKVIAA
ncbi:MAG: XRE family transcriptional regulator [Dysosmobacter sp.]|nr:XRE family transcriptional regulator [Dysosmobacter sp.]